jgi:hypothetical protein
MAQRAAAVVVPGQDVERRGEPGRELANLLVLGVGSVIGKVTGDLHRVGARHDARDGLDRGGELRDGASRPPVRTGVRVAELDEREQVYRSTSRV